MKKPIKKCQNPDCNDSIIDYKSSKKNYCNDYCRNHAGYIKRLEENKEFIFIDKQSKNNRKILKTFIDRKVYEIPINLLTIMGFNTEILINGKYYNVMGKNVYLYKIDTIYFENCLENKSIIIHNNQ